jgi:ABC-type multidrug transport system fused ATPase/permease subunit
MESGTHDELMAQKGLYYNLYMAQYGERAAVTVHAGL